MSGTDIVPRTTTPRVAALLAMAALATGCATTQPYDYTALRQSNPRSILVLPPLNESPDVNAGISVMSHATMPLAESGYYVLPVALVEQTFRENGLTTPSDIHAVAPARLREIFGADAGLYIDVTKYGTTYAIIASQTFVSANARLIDLKTGALLWAGTASAASDEGGNNSGGLVGLLVKAVVNQIMASITDQGHVVAGVATTRLLSAGMPNGILYGPRSPKYVQP
ncbi:MAG: DUF799 domain-containing protein [Rhodocyclaceae bacterium]|nr:DUF799 domain-containing protein [Rhodocyclaceae bacterium]MCB1898660.1 DUF799 domain-containing protein [Rhodocyclaceae bacterium]